MWTRGFGPALTAVVWAGLLVGCSGAEKAASGPAPAPAVTGTSAPSDTATPPDPFADEGETTGVLGVEHAVP